MAPKPELVRLAAVPAQRENRPSAVIDLAGTMPGRGAYVCRDANKDGPNRDCMSRATGRGALQRAFRRPVNVPEELVESGSR